MALPGLCIDWLPFSRYIQINEVRDSRYNSLVRVMIWSSSWQLCDLLRVVVQMTNNTRDLYLQSSLMHTVLDRTLVAQHNRTTSSNVNNIAQMSNPNPIPRTQTPPHPTHPSSPSPSPQHHSNSPPTSSTPYCPAYTHSTPHTPPPQQQPSRPSNSSSNHKRNCCAKPSRKKQLWMEHLEHSKSSANVPFLVKQYKSVP
jgi:hypothetical protein